MSMTQVSEMIEGKEQRERLGELVFLRFGEIGGMFLKARQSDYPALVENAANAIIAALEKGRKLLVFGNGGSASDAQHICGELVVRFQSNRRALAAIALSADVSVLTACGNDMGFDAVFSRQIEALGVRGDVALGISTSGNSPNVVRALRSAREQGIITILLTGPDPGPAKMFADLVLPAPGANTARIQELHLASYHAICEMLDARFFDGGARESTSTNCSCEDQ